MDTDLFFAFVTVEMTSTYLDFSTDGTRPTVSSNFND